MKSLHIFMTFKHRQTFNKKHTITIKKYNSINLQEKVVITRLRIRYLYYVVAFSSKSADLKLLFGLWHSLKEKRIIFDSAYHDLYPGTDNKMSTQNKKSFS